jgi:hypothetical protein
MLGAPVARLSVARLPVARDWRLGDTMLVMLLPAKDSNSGWFFFFFFFFSFFEPLFDDFFPTSTTIDDSFSRLKADISSSSNKLVIIQQVFAPHPLQRPNAVVAL